MKRIIYLTAIAAAAIGSTAFAKDIHIGSYKQAPAQSMPLPATPDSLAPAGGEFDASSLLQARKAADRFHRLYGPDWTTVIPDADGSISLDKAGADGAKLHVLRTRIRPERYFKGKLTATGNALMEVFVDGKSVIKKSAADTVAPAPYTLALNPEEDLDVEVHLLSLPKDSDAPKFSLRIVPEKEFEDVLVDAGTDAGRRFTLATIVTGSRLTSTSISPDGKYIILTTSESFDGKTYENRREIRETASGKTVANYLPAGARWMPKGSRLFFTEKASDGFDLYTLDLPAMTRTRLAASVPAEASNITWAPDASWFVYPQEVEGKKETEIMRRVKSPDDRIPGSRDRQYLRKYDLKSGLATQLTYGGPSTSLADISADSRKLLYLAARETPTKHPFYAVDIIQMDVNTLRTDTILRASGAVTGACYSPDASQLLISSGPNEFDGIGFNSGDVELGNDFDIQLYLYDIAGKNVKPLTKEFDPSVQGAPVWNPADNRIYFIGVDGFYQRLYCLNPADGAIRQLDAKTDVTRNFSIGDGESRWLSYTGMGYEYQGRGYLLDLKSGKNTLLGDPYADQMDGVTLGDTEVWTFTSKEGATIDGTLTLPPDFDPSKKYPLIVYYYGGTTPSNRRSDHPYTPQLFASRGYVVYILNPSGTIGYGQKFSALHVNGWGEPTAQDIIDGVKELCRTHPFINDKKIGCLGASYGGYMTQLLQTKTDIFAAAVSHAGISNVTSYWGEGYWGYSYNAVAAARKYPWSDPEYYSKWGSLFNADKIHTPLLLLHGTVDTNVPIGESIQLFNALRILDRDVELITVEGSDHVVTDYEKRKVWHATIMAWFAKYLQDDPRWWNSLYGK